MKIAKFTKYVTVALNEKIYQKIKEMTSVRGISMAAWVRRLIDEELQHLSFEEDTIESDQETEEKEHWSDDFHSNNSEDLNIRKLVLGDSDTTDKVDEIE